ncbi:MAG TPA: DUF5329 family protein [Rickettsiales bacterium]|nr:DUF5329 family protein [Rickettsiales bacterium]
MRKIASFLIIICFAFPAFAEKLSDQQRIDALLETLSTSDIVFVRNGVDMDAASARLHLEEKLKKTKGVTTVEDFINKVGSTCERTGKPYLIRQPDGKTMEAGQWFRDQLKEIPVDDSEIID